jgi:hypothetical protein
LSAGITLFLKAESIIPCATPENQFSGSSAYLGVKHKVSRRKESTQGLSCSSCCGLSWEPVGPKAWFGCWVMMSFNRQEEADRLYAGFRRSKVSLPSHLQLDVKKTDVWIERALEPGDMASLSDRLGEVMVEWIRLWKEFGGLKALAAEQT